MGDYNNLGTSTQLQVNEWNDSKMGGSVNEDTHHHQKYRKGSL